MRGVTLYVGTTGTGKTHAALDDLRTVEMDRIVLDLGGSALLSEIPTAKDSSRGASEFRLTPDSAEELDRELQRIYRRGNAAILVDDSSALPTKVLPKLCRLWRPRNLRILITTQHISGDIAQAIQACDPLIYAFRTTSTASLEWLRQWHGVTPEDMKALPMPVRQPDGTWKPGDALEISF
jgi:hypothetical protein